MRRWLPLLLSALSVAAASAQTITVLTLDGGAPPSVGLFNSQALVNGNPAISYYDSTNGDLKYVRALDAEGVGWGGPVTVASTGDLGYGTSLAVVGGVPAIGYHDVTNGDLKYVRATDPSGTTWGVPVTVDAAGFVGRYPCLTVVNGNPAMSYLDISNHTLRFVRATDGVGTGWGAPVSLGSAGASGVVSRATTLAMIESHPAIGYGDDNFSGGAVKYVRALDPNGTSWGSVVTLAATPAFDLTVSMAVVNGRPAIAYYDRSLGLRYVRAGDASGANWGTPATLDPGNGFMPSLAVIGGRPAISSYRLMSPDFTGGRLRYMRAGDSDGSNWSALISVDSSGVAVTGSRGFHSFLIEVSGNAAMSYWDNGNRSLKWATVTFDADRDGLLDSWEELWWGTKTGHGALDDWDQDGVPELLELAFGLNPTVPDSAGLPQAVNESGYLTMTITKQAGANYEVQSAGSLSPGEPEQFTSATTTVLVDNGTTLKVRDNILIDTIPKRFLRVKVTAAP